MALRTRAELQTLLTGARAQVRSLAQAKEALSARLDVQSQQTASRILQLKTRNQELGQENIRLKGMEQRFVDAEQAFEAVQAERVKDRGTIRELRGQVNGLRAEKDQLLRERMKDEGDFVVMKQRLAQQQTQLERIIAGSQIQSNLTEELLKKVTVTMKELEMLKGEKAEAEARLSRAEAEKTELERRRDLAALHTSHAFNALTRGTIDTNIQDAIDTEEVQNTTDVNEEEIGDPCYAKNCDKEATGYSQYDNMPYCSKSCELRRLAVGRAATGSANENK